MFLVFGWEPHDHASGAYDIRARCKTLEQAMDYAKQVELDGMCASILDISTEKTYALEADGSKRDAITYCKNYE